MMAHFLLIVYIILAFFLPNIHLSDKEQEKIAQQLKGGCPKYVYEGEDLRCECVSPTSVQGAKLTWDEHSDSSILTIANVSRDDNMRTFTCKMEYEKKTYEKNYTLQVAYGPTKNGIGIIPVSLTLKVTANETNPAPLTQCSVGFCHDGDLCTIPLTGTEEGWITNATCKVINVGSSQNPPPTLVKHVDLVIQKTVDEQQEYPAVLESNVVNGWMVGLIVSIVFNVLLAVAFVLVLYKPRFYEKIRSQLPFAKDPPCTEKKHQSSASVPTNISFAPGKHATNPSASGVPLPKENDNTDKIGQHNAADSSDDLKEESNEPDEKDQLLRGLSTDQAD